MRRAGLVLGAVGLALAAGTALGSNGAETFRMPSGNIFCAYQHYSFAPFELRCEIRSKLKPLPPKPATCRDAAWGEGYSLRQRGPAAILCITDTVYDKNARVLAYWTTRQFGVFRCSSTRAGLRCVNSTGHGFFLSRAHSYTFEEPAARNGAFKSPSGNIVCGWSIAPDGTASIECGVKSGLKPPPPRVHCDAGDPNDKRVSLTAGGPARAVLCAGDPGPFVVEAKASVLAYGKTWAGGGISCRSETAGVTCRNRVGHGFFVSRERWRLF